ncbi:beta-propeller domain-containing protein [Actinokineospora guangxiensis]|uniref:Beta-propeller domain-containing protein n=1 Tax=Actinokineospora guangxiensis TaxID=1490288 RepID=A0ABW0ENT8_9PSEU
MRTQPRRWPSIGTATTAIAALGAVVIGAAWYAGATDADPTPTAPVALGGALRLVAYDSCDTALADLKRAALSKVGPWGLHGSPQFARGAMSAQEDSAGAGADQGFSKTNNHEAAADEPDVVKTDGKRIVSVVDGVLRVVDVESKTMATPLTLPGHASSVLIAGERALVSYSPQPRTDTREPVEKSGLALIDLSTSRVLRTLTVDGSHLDARMVGTLARVVVRSAPRLEFTYPTDGVGEARAKSQNRRAVERSTIEDWLPNYELSPGGSGHLDCTSLSRPSGYTGTSLLSILTVDLTADLTAKDSLSIAADGDTVYGNGPSLYVADDRTPRWGVAFTSDTAMPVPSGPAKTEIHQFDVSAPGKPAYLASGVVDGWLLNQYSLSEHQGNLRVATTTGAPACCGPADSSQPPTESAVSVLERRDRALTQIGRVGGLGKNEQIYSVRYMGDLAYVVTFRRTDPLYTIDLSDPTNPEVTGELKITGFSAYLHPLANGRLLGVGQEATTDGRATGVQVSLFDVTGDAPTRVAQYHQENTYSAVEHDPHAFLYYAEENLVVMPVSDYNGKSAALLLTVTDSSITELARISTPGPQGEMTRALIAGGSLWTISYSGIQANDLTTRTQQAWLPFAN